MRAYKPARRKKFEFMKNLLQFGQISYILCLLWVKVEESGASVSSDAPALKDRIELMFLGQYLHNIDDKGRLTVPARFRDLLAAEGAYVMQGFDQNLMVLTESAFEAVSRRVGQISFTDANARLLRRLIYSTANRLEIDKVGRVLVPAFLREYAGLESEAIIIGAGEYFEVWSQKRWSEQVAQLQDSEATAQRFEPFTILFG